MKLLLDQGLPRSTIKHLADVGIVAEHVGNLGMAAATDEAILEVARQQPAVVVTLDADFHQLLAISGATMPSALADSHRRLEGGSSSQYFGPGYQHRERGARCGGLGLRHRNENSRSVSSHWWLI
jgi:uncharacterized protein DUF5615